MSETSKPTPIHWIDELTSKIIDNWPDIKHFNCNCGISVSGRQHVGRLRGEIVLTNAVVNELERAGYSASHSLILYTSDPWKGKPAQINAFKDSQEGQQYIDWRLVDVPDPTGKYSSWVDFFWQDFGDPLPLFGRDVQIVRTHELYQEKRMQDVILELIGKKEQVREILNKYRPENPFPEGWIPFNPRCSNCNRIGTTTALEVNLSSYEVRYSCKGCHTEGWADMKLGKLNWRLEWATIWYLLDVHFEPYGKDHATAGGSRDSCVEVLRSVLGHPGPYGYWNEWVGYSEGRTDYGDMTSSGFIGFTPKDWLKYASPEVLKYLYLKIPPRRRIVLGFDKIPYYIADYDRAERVYSGQETLDDPSERHAIVRSFEIVFYNEVPEYREFQLDFNHSVILAQIVLPDERGVEQAIQKLSTTEILSETPDQEGRSYISSRLTQARQWALDHAPESLRFKITDKIPDVLPDGVDRRYYDLITKLKTRLSQIKWTELEIKRCMVEIRDGEELSKKEMQQFFKTLYYLFLGSSRGPRLAPFLAALDQEWVINRLEAFETLVV
ncbi:MAG: lysine--tRNA ligase [Candidatus Thorarchaeota archaeon]